jgi:hypothetical protein
MEGSVAHRDIDVRTQRDGYGSRGHGDRLQTGPVRLTFAGIASSKVCLVWSSGGWLAIRELEYVEE